MVRGERKGRDPCDLACFPVKFHPGFTFEPAAAAAAQLRRLAWWRLGAAAASSSAAIVVRPRFAATAIEHAFRL